jgi:hypothetical protein
MANYFTILTNVGKGLVAKSIADGAPINLTQLAVGDADYTPNEGQATLSHEVWRAAINSISRPQDNPDWVVIEAVIPPEDGGWHVREVGVFDNNGDLFAVGKYPDSYKPTLPEGSGKDLYIRMILEVSNDAAVTLQIDPSVVLSTRKYVDDSLAASGIAHRYEHSQAVQAEIWEVLHNLGRDTIPCVHAYREIPSRTPVSCGDGTYCGEAYCGQSIDYTAYRDLAYMDIRKINTNQSNIVFPEAVAGKAVLIA